LGKRCGAEEKRRERRRGVKSKSEQRREGTEKKTSEVGPIARNGRAKEKRKNEGGVRGEREMLILSLDKREGRVR